MFSEAALKARYCAQMMAAASVLASTAPDDFRRRVIARSVFVYCHEFIRWARRAKNELRRRPELRETVRLLERDLNALEKRDWGPYEAIRHRIAAHRQPLDSDPGSAIASGNELWVEISDAAVRILSEDARAIWNRIAVVHDIPTLDTFPPIAADLERAIAADGYEPVPSGLLSGVGSFDGTRDDAVLVMQGGDLGAKNREIVDAVRNVRTLAHVWPAINGHEPYWRVVIAATVTEICTLVDLIYGQPSATRGQRHSSLLELLERDDPASPAIPVLVDARNALDEPSLEHVRTLRNTAGAHIDDTIPLHEIGIALQRFDPHALNAVADNALEALVAAANADSRPRPVLMLDARLQGFALASPPEAARPYDR